LGATNSFPEVFPTRSSPGISFPAARRFFTATMSAELLMERILFVGFAGLIGTLSRYWLSGWVDAKFGQTFPMGTLVVNLAGCMLAGFLFHMLTEKYLVDPITRTSVLIGFLGGFTTFSSYAVQSLTLMRDGELFMATMNVLLSNIGGLIMAWLGYSLSKAVK
jgi:CrcB protein